MQTCSAIPDRSQFGADSDPYQTFYFPSGTSDTLANFPGVS